MSQAVYEEMIRSMPAGLDRAILRVLEFHVGRGSAIGGSELTRQVGRMGFAGVDNRVVREAIKQMRRGRHLICSAPGKRGGYYMARDANEFWEFYHQEFEAKIIDMSETGAVMKRAAQEHFGPGVQGKLF